MTRAEANQYNRWRYQTVSVSEPHITSPVALALLARKLFTMDKNIYSNFRMLRLRDNWMLTQMETPDQKGGLTCAICGKQGLNPFTTNKQKLATLDHIKSIGDGGSWNDVSNFQVACDRCNRKKS